MRIARWIPDATNTHSEYVTLIAFPLQQWSQEHTSVLRYTYIGCIVTYFNPLLRYTYIGCIATSFSPLLRYTYIGCIFTYFNLLFFLFPLIFFPSFLSRFLVFLFSFSRFHCPLSPHSSFSPFPHTQFAFCYNTEVLMCRCCRLYSFLWFVKLRLSYKAKRLG